MPGHIAAVTFPLIHLVILMSGCQRSGGGVLGREGQTSRTSDAGCHTRACPSTRPYVPLGSDARMPTIVEPAPVTDAVGQSRPDAGETRAARGLRDAEISERGARAAHEAPRQPTQEPMDAEVPATVAADGGVQDAGGGQDGAMDAVPDAGCGGGCGTPTCPPLDRAPSEVLWARVWMPLATPPAGGGTSLQLDIGPADRITYLKYCGSPIDALRCNSTPSSKVFSFDSDGHDERSFFAIYHRHHPHDTAQFAVDGAGRIVTGGTFSPGNWYPWNQFEIKSFARDWTRSWLYTSVGHFYHLDVAPAGEITFLAAEDRDVPDYGGGPTPGLTLVRLSEGGEFLWQRVLGEPTGPVGTFLGDVWRLIRTAPNGDVVLLRGLPAWAERLGCPPIAAGIDEVAIRIRPDGTCRWAKPLGANRAEYFRGIFDPNGDLLLAIVTGEELPLGDGLVPQGDSDLVLARLSEDGTVRWSQRYPGTGLRGMGFALAANGQLLVMGGLQGHLDLGSLVLVGSPERIFIARLDPQGCLLGRHFMTGRGTPMMTANPDGDAIVLTRSGLDYGRTPETPLRYNHEGLWGDDLQDSSKHVQVLTRIHVGASPVEAQP